MASFLRVTAAEKTPRSASVVTTQRQRHATSGVEVSPYAFAAVAFTKRTRIRTTQNAEDTLGEAMNETRQYTGKGGIAERYGVVLWRAMRSGTCNRK